MANVHWKNAVNADFNTAADWSTGAVPGASDNAILDATGGAFDVTASTSETVNSIQLASNATLSITGGTFTANAGTGAGANAGAIVIGSRTAFAVTGGLDNTGSINLSGAGNYGAALIVNTAGATLTGGGQVVSTTTGAGNVIEGAAAGDTLTNFDNTISGSGALGNGRLTLINDAKGVIDANSGVLTLNTSGEAVTNTGLIEATNGATLTIQNTAVDDSGGGTITAASGSTVSLQGADIIGGTLVTAGTGIVLVAQSSTFDGSKFTVNNTGTVDINPRTALTIQGTVANSKSGSINVNGGGNYGAGLIAGASNATLTGGQVVLNDFGGNFIEGTVSGPGGAQTVSKLTNKTTISGAGVFGENQLSLVNTGVIDATGANALIIDTGGGNAAGSNTVVNTGLLEATNPGALSATGGLNLRSVAIANGTTGVIEANGAASHVDLQSADVMGGTLKTLNGGVIRAVDGGSTLDGTANSVNNTGVLDIGSRDTLAIQGGINNTGSINLNGAGNYGARLLVNTAGATLTGGGQVVSTTTGAGNVIQGAAAGDTLTNFNNTISGSGALGNGQLTLINDAAGVIDANAGGLTLNTSGETVTNSGLIEATNGATLTIQNTAVNNASGGKITAATGSAVNLQSADIIGGTLATAGTGVIQAVDGGSTLDGTANSVNNTGVLDIGSRDTLAIQGRINNTGSINLNGAGNYGARLLVNSAGATLTGGGQVVSTTTGAGNVIEGAAAGDTLTNFDNTISGSGALGNGHLTLINDAAGVIDANAGGLTLNTSGEAVTNSGLIEATNGATLIVQNTAVDNSGGGTISAATGSTVSLQGADIIGGTLSSSGTGIVLVAQSSTLDGTTSTVDNASTLDIAARQALTVQGTIDNTGSINLDGGGNYGAVLTLNGANVVLTGNGAIVLNGFGGNQINGSSSATTLTNDGNTLEGSGTLFHSDVTLINGPGGVVDGNQAAALVLSTPGNTITNKGTLEGTGAGGLTVSGVIAGSGGTVFAGAGSNVTLSGATLTGGSMSTAATGQIVVGNGSTATIDGVSSNAGTILVDSTGAVTSLTFDKSTSLAGGGVLELSASKNNIVGGTSTKVTLTNVDNTIEGAGKLGNNKLALVNDSGGTIDANSKLGLTIGTGKATLTNAGVIEATDDGKGTITSVVANTGTLIANDGNLTFKGAVSGSGAAQINGGAMTFDSSFTENVAFTGSTGKLVLAQSQGYTGQVSGFSTKGKTSFDLLDINGATASYSYNGTTASGILTVTDGTHTANIHLVGNYTSSTFILGTDKSGGTTVTDPAAQAPMQRFVAAAAGLGASAGGGAILTDLAAAATKPILATPLHA